MDSLICLLSLTIFSVHTSATTYCVSPEGEHVSYQGDLCRTINTYAMNSSFYFQSDTIIYFLNGTNVLDSDVTLSIQNATNVSFIGAAYNSPFGFTGTPSMITCNSTSCLSCTYVSNFTIANLAITNFRTHPDATAITLAYVKDSTLDSILVLNIFGYGVQLQNSGGQSLTIINSMFVNISGASLSLVNNSAPTYIADSQFTDCVTGGMVWNTA